VDVKRSLEKNSIIYLILSFRVKRKNKSNLVKNVRIDPITSGVRVELNGFLINGLIGNGTKKGGKHYLNGSDHQTTE
jgi:hypothetical protein